MEYTDFQDPTNQRKGASGLMLAADGIIPGKDGPEYRYESVMGY
jgi:hypothetical protein